MARMHLVTGKEGELAAMRFLRLRGYVIRDRNVRVGRDEIDLVCWDRDARMIAFIEVKTRTTRDERYPIATAVDARKKRCLRRAIMRWCTEHRYEGPARLDVVCVHGRKVTEHRKDLGSPF